MRDLTLFCLIALIATLSACGGEGGVYNLRESGPGTGWVFYVDPADAKLLPEGKTYLEAASVDQNTVDGTQWYNGTYKTTGATATAIGTGQANTTAIVAAQGTGSYAAQLCNDLVLGGYDDWFLPSKDELNKMYVNLQKGTDENDATYTPIGDFADDKAYWTSSETSYMAVLLQQFFLSGNQYDDDKAHWGAVRCIRAF